MNEYKMKETIFTSTYIKIGMIKNELIYSAKLPIF